MAGKAAASRVYIATSTGVTKINGRIHRYYQGRTVPHDSPLLRALPGRFELVDADQAGIVFGPEVREPEIQA